jgi:hypothetical protein
VCLPDQTIALIVPLGSLGALGSNPTLSVVVTAAHWYRSKEQPSLPYTLWTYGNDSITVRVSNLSNTPSMPVVLIGILVNSSGAFKAAGTEQVPALNAWSWRQVSIPVTLGSAGTSDIGTGYEAALS